MRAYANLVPNVGYCQGMNFIAGFLLVVAPKEEEAFWMFVEFLTKFEVSSFFRPKTPLLLLHLDLYESLVSQHFPKLSRHFAEYEVMKECYVPKWITTMFTYTLPFPTVARVWDLLLALGPSHGILFVSLGILTLSQVPFFRRDFFR